MFKPTRPKKVDEIIKRYAKPKTPYFFQYAKDKRADQVEPKTNNIINKIVSEINDNKQMFNSIRKLGKLDYHVLLKDNNDEYTNAQINKEFQKWNKKYGLNLKFDDEHADRNNKNMVAQTVKAELLKIESDEDKIVTSLVKYYYEKPSERKKRLLWYVYGDKLYENLCKNVGERIICHQCGAEVNHKLIRGKCRNCRQKEINLKGYKLIYCIDCGKEVIVDKGNRRTCRCEECQVKNDALNTRNRKRKQRNK